MISGKVYVTKSLIDALAAAIDTKCGTSGGGTLAQLTTKVNNIPAGGGVSLDDWLTDSVSALTYVGQTLPSYGLAGHQGPDGHGIDFILSNITSLPVSCFAQTKVKSLNAPAVTSFLSIFQCLFPALGEAQYATISLPAIVTIPANAGFQMIGASTTQSCPVLISLPALTGQRTGQAYQTTPLFGSTGTSYYNYGISEITQDTNKNGVPASGIRVYVPSLITSNKYDFANMRALVTAELQNLVTVADYAFYNDVNLTTLVLTAAETIGANAFQNCSGLTSLSLPAVETLGENCFSYCSALASITLPATITSLPAYAFESCAALTNLSLPAVKTLGSGALTGCSGLTSIVLSAEITSIPYRCFSGCRALTSVPHTTIKTIESYAFQYCASLVDMAFPEVTTIGMYAFSQCTGLKSFTIKKATGIQNYAFQGCSNLEKFIIDLDDPAGALPTLTNSPGNIFNGTKLITTGGIYITDSRVADLKAATNWTSYASHIYPLSDLPAA